MRPVFTFPMLHELRRSRGPVLTCAIGLALISAAGALVFLGLLIAGAPAVPNWRIVRWQLAGMELATVASCAAAFHYAMKLRALMYEQPRPRALENAVAAQVHWWRIAALLWVIVPYVIARLLQ